MHIEVEQKHKVDDEWDVATRLAGLGAKLGEPIEQIDQYFAHPCRDFAETDEALRIRTAGGQCDVTYKGPKLDRTTKTRQELELAVAPDDPSGQRFAELLKVLGFTPVATVHKSRREFRVQYAGHDVHGSFDVVEQVGAFVELELRADESSLEAAKDAISELAKKLELGPSLTRSYLEMLLHGPEQLRPAK
jgi:adenylate cyclase class 2